MRVMVLRNTVASGLDIFQGTIVDVSERDARILVNAGKVRTLTEADAGSLKKAMAEETERALKNLAPEKTESSSLGKSVIEAEDPTTQRPNDPTTRKTQRPEKLNDSKKETGGEA